MLGLGEADKDCKTLSLEGLLVNLSLRIVPLAVSSLRKYQLVLFDPIASKLLWLLLLIAMHMEQINACNHQLPNE